MSSLNEKTSQQPEDEILRGQNEFQEKLSAVQLQQEYFDNLPDCDWIRYDVNSRKYLLQNVAFALFGGPSLEGDMLLPFDEEQASLEGYTLRQKEQVMTIYEKICEQKKYSQNDEDIMMSVLLIVCVKPEDLPFYKREPRDHWVDLHQRNNINIWCTAVFKIRKCISTIIGEKSCRVYIDERARVYHDWESYLTKNTLPKCVIVTPEGGEYQGIKIEGEDYPVVKLTVSPTPALGLTAKVLSSVDTVNTVASLGALGVIGVSAFTPVGPAVLVGAAVATVATGVYGLVRSSMHLHDRRIHEQSISVTNSEARGSWLNITASTVGLAAGAASTLLSRSAAAGTNMTKTGQALSISVEVLRRANLITGGAGVANSLYHIIDKYRNGEKPSKLELFQFAAATLFFCNAVVSNRTAKTIIEDAQANTINEYRSTLRSNRHRKIFDKISAETRRVQGGIQGNAEVIQGIRNIANKDQYFANVLRINRDINSHKLRISMTSDGQVNLNAVHKFNPSDLYGMGRDGRSELFSSLGPATVNSSNAPTHITPSATAVNRYIDVEEEKTNNLLVGINPGEIIRIGSHLIQISAGGAESVANLLENLSRDLYDMLMTITFNLLSSMLPKDISQLRLLSPDKDLIVQIVEFVFNYLKHNRPIGDPCRNSDNGIVIVLKEFFQDGVVRRETILHLKEVLISSVEDQLRERSKIFPHKEQIRCPTCNGVRFAL